jgi:hypothetical protein
MAMFKVDPEYLKYMGEKYYKGDLEAFSRDFYEVELIERCKYHYRKVTDRQLTCRLEGCSDSISAAHEVWAWDRINLIEEIVGKEAVEKALAEVDKETEKQLGPRTWSLLLQSTGAQRAELSQKSPEEFKVGQPILNDGSAEPGK